MDSRGRWFRMSHGSGGAWHVRGVCVNKRVEKFWLGAYPDGVPAEIDPDRYSSLVAMFRDSVERFGERPAFANMGTSVSFGELDALSRDFAAFLQSHLNLGKFQYPHPSAESKIQP